MKSFQMFNSFAVQFPQHLKSFPNYAAYSGNPSAVGDAKGFAEHVLKVTRLALQVAKDVDTSAMTTHANELKDMPKHSNVSAKQIRVSIPLR